MRITNRGLTIDIDENDSDTRVAAVVKALAGGNSTGIDHVSESSPPAYGGGAAVLDRPRAASRPVARPSKEFLSPIRDQGGRGMRGPGWVGRHITCEEHLAKDSLLEAFCRQLWKSREKPEGLFWRELAKALKINDEHPSALRSSTQHLRAYCVRKDLDMNPDEVFRNKEGSYFAGPQLAVFVKRVFDHDLTSA